MVDTDVQNYEEVKEWAKQKKTNFNSVELKVMEKVYQNLLQGENLTSADIELLEWLDNILND